MHIELKMPDIRSWTVEAEEIMLGMVFHGCIGTDPERKTLLRIYNGMVNLDDFSETWIKDSRESERWTLLIRNYEECGMLKIRPDGDPQPAGEDVQQTA